MSKLQQLKALLKESTQGTWKAIVPDHESVQFRDKKARFPYDRHQEEEFKVLVMTDRCDTHAIVDCSANHTCVELMEQEDNAKFIAEAHNSLPDLIKSLEIAMEALENCDFVMCREYCGIETKGEDHRCNFLLSTKHINYANQALQEINSLLTS